MTSLSLQYCNSQTFTTTTVANNCNNIQILYYRCAILLQLYCVLENTCTIHYNNIYRAHYFVINYTKYTGGITNRTLR